MNSMTNALSVAGLKLPPTKKRVWLWLKDHPNKMMLDVKSALGITDAEASNALWDLKRRGMVSCTRDIRRVSGPLGAVRADRYTAIGAEYEVQHFLVKPHNATKPTGLITNLTPAPRQAVTSIATTPTPTQVAELHRVATAKGPTTTAPPKPTDVEPLIKQLSVTEAVRLYEALHKVFSQFKPT